MERGFFSGSGVSMQLCTRGSMDGTGSEAANNGGACTLACVGTMQAQARVTLVGQQAVLRFFHGDAWLTEVEVEALTGLISKSPDKKAVWLRGWKACEAWRRS